MVDSWVTIKIKKSTKEKLDNAIQIVKKQDNFNGLSISYNYIITRMYNRWIEL